MLYSFRKGHLEVFDFSPYIYKYHNEALLIYTWQFNPTYILNTKTPPDLIMQDWLFLIFFCYSPVVFDPLNRGTLVVRIENESAMCGSRNSELRSHDPILGSRERSLLPHHSVSWLGKERHTLLSIDHLKSFQLSQNPCLVSSACE